MENLTVLEYYLCMFFFILVLFLVTGICLFKLLQMSDIKKESKIISKENEQLKKDNEYLSKENEKLNILVDAYERLLKV